MAAKDENNGVKKPEWVMKALPWVAVVVGVLALIYGYRTFNWGFSKKEAPVQQASAQTDADRRLSEALKRVEEAERRLADNLHSKGDASAKAEAAKTAPAPVTNAVPAAPEIKYAKVTQETRFDLAPTQYTDVKIPADHKLEYRTESKVHVVPLVASVPNPQGMEDWVPINEYKGDKNSIAVVRFFNQSHTYGYWLKIWLEQKHSQ